MFRKNKLKAKFPTHPNRPKQFRTAGLEILFFVALGLFGFSLVRTVFAPPGEPLFVFEPLQPANPVAGEARGPYGARSHRALSRPEVSPVFMPTVQYWRESILLWSKEYGLDPNLVATVMQIESCGNPDARSRVGAMGLFQVMPFHFEANEQPYEPDTNALRGLSYLHAGLEKSDGHAGVALAAYNGGHGLISREYSTWPYESQRYYRWGSGIYREASSGWESSATLSAWLAAGGQSLCDQASAVLDLTATGTPTIQVSQ